MLRILGPILAILLAPLMQGLITRTKALMTGRRGAPLMQPYFDLYRLIRKGAVISTTTSRIFGLAPAGALALTAVAALMLPFGGQAASVSFAGDFIVLCYLLGTARFLMVLAALDTGSSFEGLGASREMQLGALAEPAIFLALGAMAFKSGSLSLTGINAALPAGLSPALLLGLGAIALTLLAENSRLPIDDPTTHLELTMIHEVMILDNSGPDLALWEYTASLKLWIFMGIFLSLALSGLRLGPLGGLLIWLGGFALGSVAIGLLEATLARLSLRRLPYFLAVAIALAAFSLIVQLGGIA